MNVSKNAPRVQAEGATRSEGIEHMQEQSTKETSALPLTNCCRVLRADLRLRGGEVTGTVLAEWTDALFPFVVWSVYPAGDEWQPHCGSYFRTEDDAVEAFRAVTP